MEFTFDLPSGDFTNAGFASSEIKKVLKQLQIDTKIIKRVVVALYEAEVNVVAHSFGGSVTCDIDEHRIRIAVVDSGPGIPDIDLAMTEGYSTATPEVREMGFGAGMGLPNIKNNTDYLDITSKAGDHTEIIMEIFFEEAERK